MALRQLLTKIGKEKPILSLNVTVLADISCVRGKCFYLSEFLESVCEGTVISNGREIVTFPVVYVQFTAIIKSKPRMQAKHLHIEGSPHTFQAFKLQCFSV